MRALRLFSCGWLLILGLYSVASEHTWGQNPISGDKIKITGSGTVVLDGNQAGNTDYSAAPEVTTSFLVNPA